MSTNLKIISSKSPPLSSWLITAQLNTLARNLIYLTSHIQRKEQAGLQISFYIHHTLINIPLPWGLTYFKILPSLPVLSTFKLFAVPCCSLGLSCSLFFYHFHDLCVQLQPPLCLLWSYRSHAYVKCLHSVPSYAITVLQNRERGNLSDNLFWKMQILQVVIAVKEGISVQHGW